MPINIGVWRVDGEVRALPSAGMPSEDRLEDLIEADPSILGQPLLLIGRQVSTAHGKRIDLLGIDAEGAVHVLELKKDKTPRDVIAQALDYGSWAQELSHDEVLDIYRAYRPNNAIEVAFEETFGASLPEELNTGHFLTVVAADIDPESQRIVKYLASFDIPVNVVFFRYFTDVDREYVARTWLIDQQADAGPKSRGRGKSLETWNGKDWYVSFGEEPNGRSWDDARKQCFVSAGGGDWYTNSLKAVPAGSRVWTCIPKVGYVGVGTTTGEARPMSRSGVDTTQLAGTYTHENGFEEWIIPISWDKAVPRDKAFWEKGMFANQNSACKLRNQFTLERLYPHFGITED